MLSIDKKLSTLLNLPHTYFFNFMDKDLDNLWKKVLAEIETEISRANFITLFNTSKIPITLPRFIEITPGPISNGYVTNIEGILNRVKKIIEDQVDQVIKKYGETLKMLGNE